MVYKQVCSTLHKKLCEYLPSAGKGTDGQSIERRLKKTPDFLLGQSLSDQAGWTTPAQIIIIIIATSPNAIKTQRQARNSPSRGLCGSLSCVLMEIILMP